MEEDSFPVGNRGIPKQYNFLESYVDIKLEWQ